LPNRKELYSLIDFSQHTASLPAQNPFTNVQADDYWTSSTSSVRTDYGWFVSMNDGTVNYINKTSHKNLWAVR
ncbi:hypothetical protein MCHI_003304, partial [Candidatus Magnetoovum chiemensis]